MKKKILKTVLAGILLSFSLAVSISGLAFVPASQAEAAVIRNVEWKDSLSFEKAFQKALDEARYSKGGNVIYKIKVPEGTYYAGSCFNVYSNTYIDMTNVTLVRTSSAAMFRFGRSGDVTDISGYDGFENVTFAGGTIDGNGKEHPSYTSTLLRFAHSQNIILQNMTLKNTSNSHHIEFAACQNVTIENCTFADYNGKTTSNNEAVQIEVLHRKHFGTYGKYDGTVTRNVTVKNCTFQNVQRGVGTHAGVAGSYLSNIQITDNTFDNIPGYAIIGTNYVNSTIKNNRITNAGAGIMFRNMAITYYAPEKTIKKMKKISSNSVIADNYIEVTDQKYKNVIYGIQLYGEKRTKKKNGVPKGDYRVYGVRMTGNTINLKNLGYGIWLNGAGKTQVTGNTVTLSIPKKVSGKSGGDTIRVQGGTGNRLTGNMLVNASANKKKKQFRGIQLIGKNAAKVSKNRFSGFAKKQRMAKR